MAKLINVEKNNYISSQIEIFSKNKIGEYSKFLDKNPIYITYYHVNQNLSTNDVGTGNIESELGENSPIRYNKITDFPIYNLPTLKPDVVYDETGYDIELECSDLVILPNTVKPIAGDYFLVKLAGAKEYLFRVNNFSYNTIQSNDYYLIDADIKRIGDNLEERYVANQIVDSYYTVFDNIGTSDRCFLKSDEINYVNSLYDLFNKLRDYYKNYFYDYRVNAFCYDSGLGTTCGLSILNYDAFVEKFITLANIYHNETDEETLVLSPANSLDMRFELKFNQTLYSAVLNRTIEQMKPYCYATFSGISKLTSPFRIYMIPAQATDLVLTDKSLSSDESSTIEVEMPQPLVYCPEKIPVGSLGTDDEYFSHEFLDSIINKSIDTDNYFELMIFNFIHHIPFEIDRQYILDELSTESASAFRYIPIIIYIIDKMYDEYFAMEKDYYEKFN